MASVSNPVAGTSLAGMQPTSEKDKNSGYLGVGSEGQVSVTGAFATATGQKVGFYGVTPTARPAAYTQTYNTAARTHAEEELATNLSIALLTEVAPILNKQNKAINELKKLANSVIDDLQAAGLLQ
jgi:hypothetical protein